MSAHQLKLTYFAFTGRAELTRLTLAFGGIPFEDNRLSDPAFEQLKPKLPLGQVPLLEVDGKTYVQSMAMARFAARLSGLYPTDPTEALKVDMILDSLLDAFNMYVDINWVITDEAVKATKAKYLVNELFPKTFALLEQNVSGKFFLGDKPSVADVFAFNVDTSIIKPYHPEFKVSAYLKVSSVIANVGANENVAAYLAKLPPQ